MLQDRFCVLKSLVVLVAYRSPSDRNPASVHIVNDYACRVVSAPPKTGRRMGAPVPAPPDGCGTIYVLIYPPPVSTRVSFAAFVVEDQVNRLSPRFEFRARSTSEVERWTSSFSALGKSMRGARIACRARLFTKIDSIHDRSWQSPSDFPASQPVRLTRAANKYADSSACCTPCTAREFVHLWLLQPPRMMTSWMRCKPSGSGHCVR